MLLPVPPHSPSLACGPFCLALVDPPAFWAFLWFVGFCFLANQWQVSKPKDNPMNEGTDAARAAITFSFFSIFTWVSTAARAARTLPAQPGLGCRPCRFARASCFLGPERPPASLLDAHTGPHPEEGGCRQCQQGQSPRTGDPRFGTEHPPPVIVNAPHNTLVAGSWAFTLTFSKHKQRPSREDKAPRRQETWATSWGCL